MRLSLIVLLLASYSHIYAACTKELSFYAVGASLNKAATPNLAGLAVVAIPITCDTNSVQIYSFTEHNIIPIGSGKTLTFKDVSSTGFAAPLKQIGPINLYALGNIGVATEAQSAKLAGAYGGVAVFPIWKHSAWRGVIGAQKIAGNNIYSALIGRSW